MKVNILSILVKPISVFRLLIANNYNFNIEKNLTETIIKYPIIKTEDFIIVPLYHPVAQVEKEKQLEQYKRIWDYV